MKNLLVGIDVGTTGLKVSIYTDSGQLVVRTYREYSLSFPEPGWAQVDADVWWQLLCHCMQEIGASGKVSLQDVAGIGITCTNSLVLLNSDRKAVMPAIMQLDQRAVGQAEAIKEQYGQDEIFSSTGNRVSCGAFWGPTLRWIQENRPDAFNQATYFLVPTSYLILRLTGVYSIDHSRATTTMLYNIHRKNWDPKLCEIFGVSPDLLPVISKSHEVVGAIDVAGERATGFAAGTPVIAGGMDTVGALVGLGAGAETGGLIIGSVGRICIESDIHDIRFMNAVNFDASRSLIITPVNSAGVSYKWVKNLFYGDYKGLTNVYEMMNQLADTISPGSDGLMYIPYLTGERSPIWDPHATGSFRNLTIKHSKEHFIRAVLEGVGMAIAHNFEILKDELGVDPPYLWAGGGGAGGGLWMQIISDMLGKPLRIPENLETETMGAAMLAGVGTGVFSDLSEVQRSWVHISQEHVPRTGLHAFYQERLELYKASYLSSFIEK